ncbi:MAG: class I SAM-dependent methyltransferase [Roseiflexaceae bacterium]
MSHDVARLRAHMPERVSSFLNTRTLATAQRRLAELLRPGMRVLDIGCGSGAITRGIAEAVAPGGRVVGLDINAGLIGEARKAHADVPGLSFEIAEVERFAHPATFDIVTAARVLQWLADPLGALRKMAALVKPGGRVLVLDYNHELIAWQPAPPPRFQAFYAAFLCWRADSGMDNAIADHLAELFAQAGLTEITVTPQHETATHGDPDFATRINLWPDVAGSRGHQVVADGAISEADRAAAEAEGRAWARDEAQTQTLYLLAVEGVRA